MKYEPFIVHLKRDGHPVMTFVALRPGVAGWAICCPKDQFSRKEGREKAFEDARYWAFKKREHESDWCRMPTTLEYRENHEHFRMAYPGLVKQAMKCFARQEELQCKE